MVARFGPFDSGPWHATSSANRSAKGIRLCPKTRFVRVPVTVTKRPGRKSGYLAEYGMYPHGLERSGATAAEAKTALAEAIATAVDSHEQKPTFARDDDGALWVAVPAANGGSNWYRVTGDRARYNASSSSPTASAFASCVGMTVIPQDF